MGVKPKQHQDLLLQPAKVSDDSHLDISWAYITVEFGSLYLCMVEIESVSADIL